MVQEPTPTSITVEGKTFHMAVPKSRVWRSRVGFCAAGELRSYPQSNGISGKQFCTLQVCPECQNMTSFENGIIVAVVREDDVILAWAGALPQ